MNESIILSLPLTNVKSEDYQTYTCIGRINTVDFVNASVVLSK